MATLSVLRRPRVARPQLLDLGCGGASHRQFGAECPTRPASAPTKVEDEDARCLRPGATTAHCSPVSWFSGHSPFKGREARMLRGRCIWSCTPACAYSSSATGSTWGGTVHNSAILRLARGLARSAVSKTASVLIVTGPFGMQYVTGRQRAGHHPKLHRIYWIETAGSTQASSFAKGRGRGLSCAVSRETIRCATFHHVGYGSHIGA
jgi:hypothetical protein